MPPGNRQQEKMTKPTPVALWFLLSSLLLSVCLCSIPPLSTIHEINTRGRQREQVINREGEYIDKRGRRFSEDTGGEVDVVPLSALYYLKWRDREDGSDFLKRGHSLSGLHPQLPTTPVSGKEVDAKEDANSISATPALTPNTTPTATKTSNIPMTTATTTTSYPVVHTPLYPPSSSSSCSSPACKWLASWHFIVVVCMTVTWLVALMILYWMTRTARGRRLLETWSSPCIHDKKDQEEDQVLAKGIGYFDGSPGLRRFVLIEDDDDDEEDNEEDLYAPEFQDVKNKEYKETEGGEGREDENRTSKKWKPPRKGTYILQEASKKDVLEVGTYRLQEEEEEEEEEEVDDQRKRKKEDKEEEVEYILEGATYILQSERVGRGGIGGEGYGQIGGIEGLYGIVGREGLRGGGYGRIEGLERVYRIMGRGEVREQGGYGGLGEIEGLYGILRGGTEGGGYRRVVGVGGNAGGGGGGKKRGKEDGVLLSVTELEGAVGLGEGEEKVREESTGGGRGGGEVWREMEGRGGDISEKQKGGGGGEEVKKIVGERKDRGGEGMDERAGKEGRGGGSEVGNTWGGRRGGARAKMGRVGEEGMWGGLSPPTPKRAASFPMDHFYSSHLMPRKLSLIVEEETH